MVVREMALFDKYTVRFIGGGIVGAGAVALWPYVGPVLVVMARPLVKTVIRQSMLGFEQSRERLARAAETFEDLVAEVRSEVEEERESKSEAPISQRQQSASVEPATKIRASASRESA